MRDLSPAALRELVVNYPGVWRQVSSDYTAFVAWLRQLAQQLEGV